MAFGMPQYKDYIHLPSQSDAEADINTVEHPVAHIKDMQNETGHQAHTGTGS